MKITKQYILRLLSILILALLPAMASAEAWDGTSSTEPAGQGTADDPYQIADGANLRWLMAHTDLWGSDIHFVQTADIDLGGHPLYNGLTGKGIGYGASTPFMGVYDGRGFKISNMKIEVKVQGTAKQNVSWGLFGYVSGVEGHKAVLRNIVIEGASAVIMPQTVNSAVDLKIGLLAGAIGSFVDVKNIIIRSSEITAGAESDVAAEQVVLTSLYLGGVIGDVANEFEGTATDNFDSVRLRNLYSQVDINLGNVHRALGVASGKRPGYNVGGIVGRVRKRGYTSLPDHLFYTGKIKAPRATVSPTWGLARANGDSSTAANFNYAYRGEYQTSASSYAYINQNATAVSANEAKANRFFGAYQLYNPTTDVQAYEQMTNEYPEESPSGVHTFVTPYTSGDFDPDSNDYMASYQGYGYATYADMTNDDDRSAVIAMFRRGIQDDTHLMKWSYNSATQSFALVDRLSIGIEYVQLGVYKATIKNPLEEHYKIRWLLDGVELRIDDADADFSDTYEFSIKSTTGLLRAELYNADGTPALDDGGQTIYYEFDMINAYGTYDIEIARETLPGASDDRVYIASIRNKFDSQLVHGSGSVDASGQVTGSIRNEDYAWAWYVGADPTSITSWTRVSNHSFFETERAAAFADAGASTTSMQQGWIEGGNSSRYYRAVWCRLLRDDDGNYIFEQDAAGNDIYVTDAAGNPTRIHRYEELIEDVTGPKNIIFVYNKAHTQHGRDLEVTTFDGIDASTSLPFPDGRDINYGHTPYNAVRTMKRAYELLDPELGRDGNVIVVMGYYYDVADDGDVMSWQQADSNTELAEQKSLFKGACTITGNMGGLIYDGALNFATPNDRLPLMIYGPTAFEDITWVGYNTPEKVVSKDSGAAFRDQLLFNLNHYDLYIGRGLKIIRYRNESKSGLVSGAPSPYITIIAGAPNWDAKYIVTPDESTQENPGYTTITINSGCFARIIGSARNTENHSTSHNIYGSPAQPNRVKINIAISHAVPKTGLYVSKEYCPEDNYKYDIGLVTGGQTDGTAFSESEVTITDGYIGRFISGNISYGRNVNTIADYNFPTDSFYGKTTLNLINGSIAELYGGSLGRSQTEGTGYVDKVQCYFYGQSIINIRGGEILGSVYGAGAGGVAGVGDDTYHTEDTFIPFNLYDEATGTFSLSYGSYDQIKEAPVGPGQTADVASKVASVQLYDGTELNLSDSSCEVNISGGKILGSVYGGGYGYSDNITYTKAVSQAGNLYGNAYVRMLKGESAQPEVYGSVYGGGCGSSEYYKQALKANEPEMAETFLQLAQLVGNTEVQLDNGIVYGSVYGAGAGVLGEKFKDMGALVGNSRLTINGATINGNVYGGSFVGDVVHHEGAEFADTPEHSGNTFVEISSGTIGNCIFGGSEGYLNASEPEKNITAYVQGSTTVRVLGGSYIKNPYQTDANGTILKEKGQPKPRTFNIYGGGYLNCVVEGSTDVYIEKSLLTSEESLESRPGETPEMAFKRNFADFKYRRFCVYGGGFGENTIVKGQPAFTKLTDDEGHPITVPAAKICINVLNDVGGIVVPTGDPIDRLVAMQTFFDVAGGGYSGDVGFWTSVEYQKDGGGNYVLDEGGDRIPIESTRKSILDMVAQGENPALDHYDEYVNGAVEVTIKGFPFIRKVFGGGFYSSVGETNTHIYSGAINDVYGGALLGYVHKSARLQIGTLLDDPAYTAAETSYNNAHLFILDSVYGGNDVKGIIGTTLWKDAGFDEINVDAPSYGRDGVDGRPMFTANADDREDNGVNMLLFGGTIKNNVYGAGNGHYRGYYVPGWLRYDDGTGRHYRTVRSLHPEFKDPTNPNNNSHREDPAYVTNLLLDDEGQPQRDSFGRVIYTGLVYRSQPMVGSVRMYIGGNTETDRVKIGGNVYGGGRSCTIGVWNTVLPFEDPRRLSYGGVLRMNFGSHVTVGGNLYMGVSGAEYARQVPIDPAAGIDLATFDGSLTTELDKLGETAYKHWYFDEELGYYRPGFPPPGKVDGNFHMHGGHMFRGYMKKIEMNGDVALTFYHDPFERDGSGKHLKDARGQIIRKHWVPGELAINEYDAQDVVINSVFCGAECGSMTNNKMMRYDYDNNRPIPSMSDEASGDIENYGSIYRVALPYGLTVLDKVVGGSENAVIENFPYSVDGTQVLNTQQKVDGEGHPVVDGEGNPVMERAQAPYRYEGGIITQEIFSYELIVTCDRNGKPWSEMKPSDFELDPSDPAYNEYTLKDGTHIYRRNYTQTNPFYPNGDLLNLPRYSVAEVEIDGVRYPYIGPKTLREPFLFGDEEDQDFQNTILKLTVACEFDPQEGDHIEGEEMTDEHQNHFGGVVYGGCFNSGVIDGDVIINCMSNLLGDHMDAFDPVTFGGISSLKYNLGRVFGGGYGENSRVDGDTYVNLLHNFVGMNVFGGGCRGNVYGSASVNYVGAEDKSFVFGAIYGGGLYGSVGISDISRSATMVNLVSGTVDKVYGGSCMGNLYGRAEVDLCDKVESYSNHFDYNRLRKLDPTFDTWAGSRLLVGSVFGGNDISGNIYLPDAPAAPATPKDESDPASVAEWNRYEAAYARYDEVEKYSTTVRIWESSEVEDVETGGESIGPGKDSPGAKGGYNGYPLVGNMYGGSNGNYGVHGTDDYYTDGVLQMAIGERNTIMNLQLGGNSEGDPLANDQTKSYPAFQLPHLDYSRLIISGGTVVNAYGGGDMATVSKDTKITVNYVADQSEKLGNTHARAGFSTNDEFLRLWNAAHLRHIEQLEEVSRTDEEGNTIFLFNIYRLFGGNNKADMAIQPTWELERGHVGSVYSGGNFGKMTYCATETTEEDGVTTMKPLHGLRLDINSRDFHAESVYGGGRVGDVEPDFSNLPSELLDASGNLIDAEDFYGAVVEINDGVIDHVFGGNDVSGNINYGTKVVITGAISGDVYCAGNGNYRYKYDPSIAPGTRIAEDYDDEVGGRYFILPQNPCYGGDNPTNPALKLLAINSYRPNVERAYLRIGGLSADKPAYVRGNVYCGGNSSSVHPTGDRTDLKNIIFDLGDNVVLNGVFMGSNGENLASGESIKTMQYLNGFDLTQRNRLESGEIDLDPEIADVYLKDARRDASTAYGNVPATNKELYPTLLDLYMRAAKVDGIPKDFDFPDNLQNAYIGDFYVGGNTGSMMTREKITLTFPESLTIYGKIVGGSNNAVVKYGSATHTGGLSAPVDATPDALGNVNTTKLHLVVKSKFEPWKIDYNPEDYRNIRLIADVEEREGKFVFPQTKCMVYGGCFNSGSVVGDIKIDLLSDMVKEYDLTSPIGIELRDKYGVGVTTTKRRMIIDRVDLDSRRSFGVVGGGFGEGTSVRGNVDIRLLPGKVHPTYNATATEERPYVSDAHPSAATIFGASQMGEFIGNTTIELRDGMVLTNMYGASEAAPMYGSTQTIIGWPEYYVSKQSRRYEINRTDDKSEAATDGWSSEDGRMAVLDYIYLRKGEFISRALYYQLKDDVGDGLTKAECFDLIDGDKPQNFAANHPDEYAGSEDYDPHLSWDDIAISVGYRNQSMNPGFAETTIDGGYYGHGNVYGGGFVSAKSSLAGQYTVRRFSDLRNLDPADVGFGGNSTILVWDNKENSYVNFTGTHATGDILDNYGNATITGSGAEIRDHITIGTARYKRVNMKVGQDVIGKYVWDEDLQHYIHQSSHVLGTDAAGHKLADPSSDPLLANVYYEIESDGGIYGGGRKVNMEGFRHCDLSYYGYADYSPQFPKLLNTFQRLDLLTVTDCCLQLQGATDFATNNVDATHYSLTRIGELQMVSSLNTDEDLNAGVREATGLCNITHGTKRTRNYVAFFNSVRYVAAVTSSQSFDEKFHGADGKLYTLGDLNPTAPTPAPRLKDEDVINWANYPLYHEPSGSFSYRDYKAARVDNYYAYRDLPVPTDGVTSPELSMNQNVKVRTSREFDKRNIGTAANMIGINNGYTLKVQGSVVDENGVDKTYYGPINGVVEIKLLTLAQNEGGGYIFALNHHEDPTNFLETTGNFVFPGAAYLVSAEEGQHYNYIYDDCFPMGQGYDSYAAKGDCNELQDIHYWYVNGTNYYYNVTLTAYTFNNNIDFTLDNNDQLIYLYGLEPGAKLSIVSVNWDTSDNEESDIQNIATNGEGAYEKDYKLYLSVDKNPTYAHTTDADNLYRDHSFIAPIPRAEYPVAEGDTGDPLVDMAESSIVNNYSDYETEANMPLLGISLIDHVDNTGKDYYDRHLKEAEKVRIEVTSQEGDASFKYVVNLTIKYLLGPTITGVPVIENCALPGEYIFANAFDVDVDLDDDNMAVTGHNWYIVAPEYPLTSQSEVRQVIDGIGSTNPETRTVGEKLNEEVFDDGNQVHIPAYFYRDKWHLIYEIIANNMSFYLHPTTDVESLADLSKQLVVHNYHRMKPYDGVSLIDDGEGNMVERIEDLMLTKDARIYIENDDDMAYFYKWLKKLQVDGGRRSPRGYRIDPQYGDSLQVYLMANVKMPSIDKSEVEGLEFRGTFHGMGYSIDMGTNELFLGKNSGWFYNTGFISHRTTKTHHSDAVVFGDNRRHEVAYLDGETERTKLEGGHIEDCFFYNSDDQENGYLIEPSARATTDGAVINCYRTANDNTKESFDNGIDGVVGLTKASLDEFCFGEVAYNLNRFYLNSRLLEGRNLALDDPSVDDDTHRTVSTIDDIYCDGSYRFARWSPEGNATALRTAEVPNYFDRLRIRSQIMSTQFEAAGVTGRMATMHNTNAPIDEIRVVKNGDEYVKDEYGRLSYLPVEMDYIFFGQDLSKLPYERPYPQSLVRTDDMPNRVYRASGFYRSRNDKGFYFNPAAQADHPALTAIDFTGIRDVELNRGYGKGEVTIGTETCYYPPMLDLPKDGITSFVTSREIADANPTLPIDQAVTRNLLVYNWADDPLFDKYDYNHATPESSIYCHVVNPTRDGETTRPLVGDSNKPVTRHLHLVDREDFNAPIAVMVTDSIWYQRRPEVFASVYELGYTGWDGVVLPFTAQRVIAEADGDVNHDRDHGELSHFYGPYEDDNVEAPSHEYWLRKFTGVASDRMVFHRPGAAEDNNPQEPERINYFYNNTYFSRVFANIYDDGTTHARPEYRVDDPTTPDDDDQVGRTYNDYPLVNTRYPYIVAWPGEKFYEFDLSGTFYTQMFPSAQKVPQVMNFIATGNQVIPVSDLNPPLEFAHDGYTLTGTYLHKAPEAYMAVVDELGNHFEKADAGKRWAVDPFRVYVTTPYSLNEPLPITSRSTQSLLDPIGEGQGEGEDADDQEKAKELEIFVEGNVLTIMSPFEQPMNLPLFDFTGRLIKFLPVYDGENRYPELVPGFYFTGGVKFGIR